MCPTSFVKTLFVLSVAALLLPQATRAVDCTEKPNHPQCEPGSEGQPVTPARITFADAVDHEIRSDGHTVALKADPAWFPIPDKPTYAPADLDASCLAETPGTNSFVAVFPRHDLCATVTTSTGAQLTDDIVIRVPKDQGVLASVQLVGQDVIGEEGIAHESEQIALLPPIEPDAAGFTIHVHADSVPVWKLSRHLGGKRVEIIGYISIADMVYTPK